MEAKVLPKKKSISKGKIKKSIKNVISRPDPVHWPSLSEDESKIVVKALSKHKVDIPLFKKPHWQDIKNIPKKDRPKPPPPKKVEGLIFGISETLEQIKNEKCSAVILDSEVNPQMIMYPLLGACVNAKVPVVCLNNLKKTSFHCFGIRTSCLSVNTGFLLDLSEVITEIAKTKEPQTTKQELIKMEVTEEPTILSTCETSNLTNSVSVYLFRTDKKTRVFVPGDQEIKDKSRTFSGQNFIELGENNPITANSTVFRKMILKRVSNNPNRVKRK